VTQTVCQLPAPFAVLAPFVATWAVDRAAERSARRGQSTPAERQAFYDAAVGLLPAALTYLNERPLTKLNEGERCLMQLMLALAHVSLAVEVQGRDEPAHAMSAQHMRIISATSDRD
jgi:ABC-type hemin transport system ATPase subunit